MVSSEQTRYTRWQESRISRMGKQITVMDRRSERELNLQGGVANLWWLADPKTGIAAVVFNSILPYGRE